MALPLGSAHWASSGCQLSLRGSKVFGATVGVSQPWEGGARLPIPLPPRSTRALTCPVSPPPHPARASGSESQPGQGQSPPVVCSKWQSRRVWLGGPGEGDGHWAPPRAASPSPHLGWCPACVWEHRRSQKAGRPGRGDLGAALGYHLRHGGPSASWDNRAVIPEGPLRRGCPEHLCQVWLPRGRRAPSPPVPGAVETGPAPHVCPRVGTRLVHGDP